MKKQLYLMLTALLFSCMAALGQNSNSNTNNGNEQKNHEDSIARKKIVEEMATVETETMSELIEPALTPDQKKKIMKINLDFFDKKTEAKDRHAPDEEFRLMYQNREDSLKLVLKPEQLSRWKGNPITRKIQEENNKKK